MNMLQRKKAAFLTLLANVKGFRRTVIGVPPLTLYDVVDEDSLINIKIYGNSDGVGDETLNLFNPDWFKDEVSTGGGITATKIGNEYKINGEQIFDNNTTLQFTTAEGFDTITEAGEYTFEVIKTGGNIVYDKLRIYMYARDRLLGTTTIDAGAEDGIKSVIPILISDTDKPQGLRFVFYFFSKASQSTTNGYKYENCTFKLQFVKGSYTSSSIPPYEPYGYKIPVNINGGGVSETTNVYINEPLRKTGDYTDYIDWKNSQAVRYNSEGEETRETINLPEILLYEGDNILTVDTNVQPSNMEVTYYSTSKGE